MIHPLQLDRFVPEFRPITTAHLIIHALDKLLSRQAHLESNRLGQPTPPLLNLLQILPLNSQVSKRPTGNLMMKDHRIRIRKRPVRTGGNASRHARRKRLNDYIDRSLARLHALQNIVARHDRSPGGIVNDNENREHRVLVVKIVKPRGNVVRRFKRNRAVQSNATVTNHQSIALMWILQPLRFGIGIVVSRQLNLLTLHARLHRGNLRPRLRLLHPLLRLLDLRLGLDHRTLKQQTVAFES